MSANILELLIELSKQRGVTTTSKLSKKLDSSQQTISRKIRHLEKEGLIHRTSHQKGQVVTLTEKGRSFIRKKYLELRDMVEHSDASGISFGGNLVSGSGEGKYYVGQDGYFVQFHDKLGFRPFLGTLNIKMENIHHMKAKNEMEKTKSVMINGFKSDKREFGNIKCYPCLINKKIKGAVIIPERTHHPSNIVEIISHINLRKKLPAKNDSYIHIELKT